MSHSVHEPTLDQVLEEIVDRWRNEVDEGALRIADTLLGDYKKLATAAGDWNVMARYMHHEQCQDICGWTFTELTRGLMLWADVSESGIDPSALQRLVDIIDQRSANDGRDQKRDFQFEHENLLRESLIVARRIEGLGTYHRWVEGGKTYQWKPTGQPTRAEIKREDQLSKLRDAISKKSKTAKPDTIVATAGIRRSDGLRLLNWLQKNGEYAGFES